jgi:hypothetical protein
MAPVAAVALFAAVRGGWPGALACALTGAPWASLAYYAYAFGRPGQMWRIAPIALTGLALVAFGLWRFRRGLDVFSASWCTIASGAAASCLLFGATTWWEERRQAQARIERQQLLATLPPAPPATAPYERLFFQRGVAFTAEAGVRYGSAPARGNLAELPAFGVNAIAIVPYGGSRMVGGRITIRTAGRGSWENDEGVEVTAAVARQLGMRVMLKPHVWRMTEEQVASAELRRQWFDEYGRFIEHYARLATKIHADLFCVGTEFQQLSRQDDEWRKIIARVRALYAGPLTYAPTQGPEFESITFWDALDYIGLDNYYPLPDDYSTAELLAKVEAVHNKYGKPVLFTEAGFSAVENAHRAPWEDETDKPLSLEEQARCYEALLKAFYEKPWFYGVYWWKVGTNGYGGPQNNSMTPWRKPAMDVVKRWYLSGKR